MAHIINANILAHVQQPTRFSYDPESRERRIRPVSEANGAYKAVFTGNRIDLIGRKSPRGGSLRVLIDGKTAAQRESFLMSYVQPDPSNAKEGKGRQPSRSIAPRRRTRRRCDSPALDTRHDQ